MLDFFGPTGIVANTFSPTGGFSIPDLGRGKSSARRVVLSTRTLTGHFAMKYSCCPEVSSNGASWTTSAEIQLDCAPHERSVMARKIDPLNKKLYGSVTAILTVTDVKAAAAFYQKAFGFAKRGIMNGPDGKAIHAELTLRGTTLMLGPEMPQMGSRSAKTVGASPTSLYLLTENADKAVAKAVKLGAAPKGPVMDMFWGDRCGTVVDPEGYTWMVATHIAQPTPKEMQQRMKEQMDSQQAARAASGS
jgi:PhnB protein